MQKITDINTHIANLAHQTNKVIAKYAQLEMCRIKNIIVVIKKIRRASDVSFFSPSINENRSQQPIQGTSEQDMVRLQMQVHVQMSL